VIDVTFGNQWLKSVLTRGKFWLEAEFLKILDSSQTWLGLSLAKGSLQESEGLCFSEAGNHLWLYSGAKVTVENSYMINVNIFGIQDHVKTQKKYCLYKIVSLQRWQSYIYMACLDHCVAPWRTHWYIYKEWPQWGYRLLLFVEKGVIQWSVSCPFGKSDW